METDAIVLDINDHGESDVIVTLFARHEGRVRAIAKGARKSLRRFVNKLEPFSFLHVVCRRKSLDALAFLAEAELHSAFFNIRNDLELYTVASVIQEFLLIAIKDEQPDERIFRLSLWSLHHLDRQHTPRAVLALFLIRFFEYLGYRPDLEHCGGCRRAVTATAQCHFHPEWGALVCSHCRSAATVTTPLSPGTVKVLRVAQHLPLERLDRLRLSGPMLQEALAMLHHYGRNLLQRDIVSWRQLRRTPRPSAKPAMSDDHACQPDPAPIRALTIKEDLI